MTSLAFEERVIAYVSRNFTETERLYCARKRELLAITRLVKHFDVYLRGTSFVVRTDHASLQYIKTLKEMPLHFQRWIMQLEEYSYKIVIRKSALHGNADAMSRGCHGKECICIPVAKWEAVKGITRPIMQMSCIVMPTLSIGAKNHTSMMGVTDRHRYHTSPAG